MRHLLDVCLHKSKVLLNDNMLFLVHSQLHVSQYTKDFCNESRKKNHFVQGDALYNKISFTADTSELIESEIQLM